MQAINLAQRIRNKEFTTNEQVAEELQDQIGLWHIGTEPYVDLHVFLGFTYPEFCFVTVTPYEVLDMFENGQILVDITEDQLNNLYVEWCQIPAPRYERFGQYVYNQMKFEVSSSYEERDPEKAYQILLGACTSE